MSIFDHIGKDWLIARYLFGIDLTDDAGNPFPDEMFDHALRAAVAQLEGELGHIIDGVPHILKPGMVGIVKAPDLVIHKSESKEGARALVIWPLGKEVKAIEKEALADPEARVIELRP